MDDDFEQGMEVSTSHKFALAVLTQVDQFRREFNLSYSEAIGVLDMVKYDLHREAYERAERIVEDEEEE